MGDVLKYYHVIDLLLYVPILYTAVVILLLAPHFIPPVATAVMFLPPFCFKLEEERFFDVLTGAERRMTIMIGAVVKNGTIF